jgi:hypothetical protein
MPLIALWGSNPAAIAQFSIEQVVAAAGSGDLKDNSECAKELREYLSQVTSHKLAEYVDIVLQRLFLREAWSFRISLTSSGDA